MKRLRTLARAGAVLATAALLVPAGPVQQASGKRQKATDFPVGIHVDDVSPSTPTASTARHRLLVTLTVTNTTADDIDNLHILADRGDPIRTQAQLDASIANPVAPANGLPIPADPAAVIPTLLAYTSITVEFRTTTSTVDDRTGICICSSPVTGPLIYPLFFTAHQVKGGVDNLLGVTSTYMPAFYAKPQPVRVSWVWPLLERPHRFIDDTQFTDDTLAESVSTGRLSRALDVVEQVGPRIPMTLLIDPELLDELEVMSTGQYTVLNGDGKTTTPGVGEPAATAWLDQLRNVLLNDPKVSVQLTPYADPDVETLTERGLNWSTTMPPAMAERVTQALAGRAPDSTLAWPVSGAISKPTVHRFFAQGVNTALLNTSAVRVRVADGALTPQLVRLPGQPGQTVAAALLSPAIEKYAANAISSGGAGAAAIPALIAELAVRATQEPDVEQSVTIAAPRYIDPDVSAAVRAIEETSRSTFATPIALSDAVLNSTLVSNLTTELGKIPATVSANLPATMTAADAAERTGLRLTRSLLDTKNDTSAAALVAALPSAIQRAESSAWRDPANLSAAGRYADLLGDEFDQLERGVEFVGPPSGSYTLASNTAPLPITISNKLPYAVLVRPKIVAQTPGFKSTPIKVQSIEARTSKTVQIPTTTERSGLFKINVLLQAPNGRPVGEARTMQVRSTALGVIGVIIMIVAGSVLGIALLWRVVRRLRNRRQPGVPPADAVRVATPEPVA